MRQTPLTALAALLATVWLAGCEYTTVAHPIGRPATPADVPNLDGVWQQADQAVVFVKFLDNGELRVATVDWNNDRFVLEEMNLLLTIDDEALYLMHANENESSSDDRHYTFMRVLRPDDHTLVLVPENVRAFRDAVEEGVIPGTVMRGGWDFQGRDEDQEAEAAPTYRGGRVRIEADAETLSAFIRPERIGEQFKLEWAIVLRRIAAAATSDDDDDDE